MGVCPHPLLAGHVAAGATLRYVRLTVPAGSAAAKRWRASLRELRVVPLHVSGESGTNVLAIVAEPALEHLINALFGLQLLGDPDAPLLSDLYLLRDDRAVRSGFLDSRGQSASLLTKPGTARWLLGSSGRGLLVAVPADKSIEQLHFEEAQHGHNEKLIPDVTLLEPFGTGIESRAAGWVTAVAAAPAPPAAITADELAALAAITPQAIRERVDRYAGVVQLDDFDTGSKVVSRHICHADNRRCVNALARELRRTGAPSGNGGGEPSLRVHLHRFTHEGESLFNVVAELAGDTPELVLVSAHLDSTSAGSQPYDPCKHSAAGADDDASGVAGVLAIAEVLAELSRARRPRRTLRFVLFNAEEHGLVGSKAYAKAEAAVAAPIVAVFQMDMIGYNRKSPRSFELHIGYLPSPEVQARSRALAERVAVLVPALSPKLPAPQIYQSADADNSDPAEGRSDHAPFLERGYAACVVSEDFFIGPSRDSPAPEANPNYHKKTDNFVDAAYAADIARVIAGAAWFTANS